jgi:hypothetical protein
MDFFYEHLFSIKKEVRNFSGKCESNEGKFNDIMPYRSALLVVQMCNKKLFSIHFNSIILHPEIQYT